MSRERKEELQAANMEKLWIRNHTWYLMGNVSASRVSAQEMSKFNSKTLVITLRIFLLFFFFFFFFFWLHPWHVEVPQPRTEPVSQQQPKLQQWQCQILNPLHHQGTPTLWIFIRCTGQHGEKWWGRSFGKQHAYELREKSYVTRWLSPIENL